MFFSNNTKLYDFGTKLAVWLKAWPIDGLDPASWRTDRYGSRINWSAYGDRQSVYGWEIDHIIPQSKGGCDDIVNLQPLHWKNNAHKSDKI